jgi:hypothetical protein
VADSRIEKWLRWLEDEIQPEVMTMNLHRHVFQEVGEIIEANGSLPPSYWFEFSSDTYATTQAIAIRRQAETGTRVISLGQLIAEIRDNADLLTRAWWIGLWTTRTWSTTASRTRASPSSSRPTAATTWTRPSQRPTWPS